MPVKIPMPALSPTMTEGKLAKWLIGEGDSVNSGDVIAEIETDKATMEVEAVEEGKLGKIIVPEGSEGVPVNNVIALLLEEGEDRSSLEGVDVGVAPTGGNGSAPPPATTPEPPVAPALQSAPSSTQVPAAALAGGPDCRIIASPLARRMAAQAVPSTRLPPSGLALPWEPYRVTPTSPPRTILMACWVLSRRAEISMPLRWLRALQFSPAV